MPGNHQYMPLSCSDPLGLVSDGSYDPADWQTRNLPPPNETFNLIDHWVRGRICTPLVSFILRSERIETRIDRIRRALFSFVLSLADMQLVTGIAMLAAAVIKLYRGNISVYHFSMMTNLAWFSSNVHLLALLAIRTELVGSFKHGRRWSPPPLQAGLSMAGRARSAFSWGGDILVRVIAMLTLAALLLYCSYVSGVRGWYDNYNCPAACANGKGKGGQPLAWMVVNFALVLLTYPERCLFLWPKAGEWWIDKARHWIVDYQGRPKPDRDQRISLWQKGFAWVWYVGSSETLGVAVSGFLWFALGVYWTFDDRNTTHAEWKDYSDIGKKNDVEGFGQLMSLLLLGLPFLQVLETYCAQTRETQRESQESNQSESQHSEPNQSESQEPNQNEGQELKQGELRALTSTRLNARTI